MNKRNKNMPVNVHRVTEEPPEPVYEWKNLWTANIKKTKALRGNIILLNGESFF
jgi:hypothetical protein